MGFRGSLYGRIKCFHFNHNQTKDGGFLLFTLVLSCTIELLHELLIIQSWSLAMYHYGRIPLVNAAGEIVRASGRLFMAPNADGPRTRVIFYGFYLLIFISYQCLASMQANLLCIKY